MVKKLFAKKYNKIDEPERLAIIERSARQVSRGVFYSTVIIITSFLPVFMLTGQGGKIIPSIGLHENIYSGGGCNSGSNPCTGHYFFLYEGPIYRWQQESSQSISGANLRAGDPCLYEVEKDNDWSLLLALLVSIPLLIEPWKGIHAPA